MRDKDPNHPWGIDWDPRLYRITREDYPAAERKYRIAAAWLGIVAAVSFWAFVLFFLAKACR